MKKNFRFCILFILIFLFNTLIAKAEREVKKEDIELKNGIIYFKGEENSYNGIVTDLENNKIKMKEIDKYGNFYKNSKIYLDEIQLLAIKNYKIGV